MSEYIAPLQRLIEQFRRLDGIGGKTAARLAFSLLSLDEESVAEFADAVIGAKRDIHTCPECGNLSTGGLCDVCSSESRDRGVICVVEDARDVMAMERVRDYNGMYHVLGGSVSPLDSKRSQLNIPRLLERVGSGEVREVIIATNPTVEGEATAMYIAKLLEKYDVEISRLAYGIPVGGDLEYADEVTLHRAIEGRRTFGKKHGSN